MGKQQPLGGSTYHFIIIMPLFTIPFIKVTIYAIS